MAEDELKEWDDIYCLKALTEDTARRVAKELPAHHALAAHAEAELHIDPDDLTNPWHTAAASAIAFTLGALLPLNAMLLAPSGHTVIVTVLVLRVALASAGSLGARIGEASSPGTTPAWCSAERRDSHSPIAISRALRTAVG